MDDVEDLAVDELAFVVDEFNHCLLVEVWVVDFVRRSWQHLKGTRLIWIES